MRCPVKIALFLFLLLSCLQVFSQTAGFTATIGINTFTVKNGDVLYVCKGGSILYTSTATNYNNLSWFYTNGGAVQTESVPSFNVSYNQAGNGFFTLQKVKLDSKVDSIKVKVVVTDKEANLNADFTITPATIECANTNFIFDGTASTGTGLSYYWQFSDGTKSTGAIVTHSFNSAIGITGTESFNVRLTVTNAFGCSEVITKTITVNKIPDVDLIPDGDNCEVTSFNDIVTFCKQDSIPEYVFSFLNNSQTALGNTRYIFNWGDGSKNDTLKNWGLGQSIQHKYLPGNNILTLTVDGSNGCTAFKKFNVFLGYNRGSSFGTVTGQTDYCQGQYKEFKFTPGLNNPPGTQYILHVDDCSVDSVFVDLPGGVERIVKHYFNTPNCENPCGFKPTYTCTLSVVTPCKTNRYITPDLTVSGRPKARMVGDTIGCTNVQMPFSNISSFGTVYESGTCKNSGVQVWTVSPSAGAVFNTSEAGSLNGNSTDATKWTNGAATLNVTFTQAGTYTITLYVSNKKCGIDSTSMIVCIQNKPSGGFSFVNIDTDGCFSDTVLLQNKTLPGTCLANKFQWDITSSDPNGCSNGNIPVFISGNDTSFSPQVWFKEPGNYSIRLLSNPGNACSSDTVQNLVIKGLPKITSINNINSICAGNTISPNASVIDCYSGDSLLYKWTFSNGVPSTSPLVIPGNIKYDQGGTQKILIAVTNSCGTATDSVNFEVTNKPTAEAGPVKEICSGDPATIGTNTGNFIYHWSPSTGLNNPDIAQPTLTLVNNNDKNDTLKYFVTVSGGVDCEATDSVLVIVKKSPLVTTNTPAATVCEGSSIQLTASGADTYVWSPATYLNTNIGNTVISTPSGSVIYTVTGSFANGCSNTATINIDFAKTPVADAGPLKEICSGSSATIGINTGAYNYSWSPVNGLSNPNVVQPTVTLTNNNSINDTITYYLTASLGICSALDSVQVVVKKAPAVTTNIATAIVCEGNNVQLIASGADTYTWTPATYLNNSTGSSVICTPLSSVVYTVTGALNNGCNNSTDINIQFAKTPVADAGMLKELCSGSSVTIGVNTGPYNYLWSPGTGLNDIHVAQPAVTLTNNNIINDTVTYYLTTTLGTCISKDSVQVVVKKSPDISITPPTPQICIGNSISLTANGADSYQWTPQDFLNSTNTPSVIASPVSDITYSVHGSLQNGCDQTKSVTVKVNPDAIASFTPLSYSGCAPYNLDSIITTNNYPLINAKYYWYINNNLYDSSNTAVPVSYNLPNAGDSVIVQLIATSLYGCKPDTLGPVIFKTGDGIKALYNQSAISGCEPLSIQFTNTSSILDNSVAFSWNFGNGQISSDIQPGTILFNSGPESRDTTYFVKLVAKNTCATDSLKTSVHVLPKPVARFASDDSTAGCSPYTMTFKNTSKGNPLKYEWDFGDGSRLSTTKDTAVTHTYNTSVLDTFIIKLIAFNNCGTDTLLLPVVIAPNTISAQVSIFGNNIYGCLPHTVNFINNTIGALNGTWNYGDGTGEILPGNIVNVSHTFRDTGTFTVTVNFDNGCSKASYSEQIFVYSRPQASFLLLDTTNHYICFKDSVHINITQQTGDLNRLYWGDNNLYFSPPVTSHYYNNTGVYNIMLIADRNNSFGTVCSDTAIETAHIVSRPDTKATSSNEVTCFKPYSQLMATGGRLYQWYPVYGLDKPDVYNPVARPVENTLYYVKITGESGCVVKDSVMVFVDFTKASSKDFVPSGFTPNGDGLNDCIHVLKAGIYGQNIDKLDFNIYNRLGELLFHTNNTSDCWNGYYKGRLQPPGTYVYTLRLQSICTEGKDLFFKGTIVLIK